MLFPFNKQQDHSLDQIVITGNVNGTDIFLKKNLTLGDDKV